MCLSGRFVFPVCPNAIPAAKPLSVLLETPAARRKAGRVAVWAARERMESMLEHGSGS